MDLRANKDQNMIVILKQRTETNRTFSSNFINNYTVALTLENNLFPSSYLQSKCMKINNASKQNHSPEQIKAINSFAKQYVLTTCQALSNKALQQ